MKLGIHSLVSRIHLNAELLKSISNSRTNEAIYHGGFNQRQRGASQLISSFEQIHFKMTLGSEAPLSEIEHDHQMKS